MLFEICLASCAAGPVTTIKRPKASTIASLKHLPPRAGAGRNGAAPGAWSVHDFPATYRPPEGEFQAAGPFNSLRCAAFLVLDAALMTDESMLRLSRTKNRLSI